MKLKFNAKSNGASVNHKTGEVTIPKKKYVFTPDKELLQFAEDFSNNYLTQDTGIYKSKLTEKYTIDYQQDDMPLGRRNFSLDRSLGHLIFSKDKLITYNKNFVFYIVLWLSIFADIHKLQSGLDYVGSSAEPKELTIEEQADKHALRWYLINTRRSKKDIMLGFVKSIEKAATSLNIRRIASYYKTLSKTLSA